MSAVGAVLAMLGLLGCQEAGTGAALAPPSEAPDVRPGEPAGSAERDVYGDPGCASRCAGQPVSCARLRDSWRELAGYDVEIPTEPGTDLVCGFISYVPAFEPGCGPARDGPLPAGILCGSLMMSDAELEHGGETHLPLLVARTLSTSPAR